MKKNLLKILAIFCFTLFAGAFVACDGDGDDPDPIDKTELNALLDSCQTIVNNASTDDYTQTSIDALQSTITTVKTAAEAATSQTVITNLTTQLSKALSSFLASELDAIDDTALLMEMTFDETVSNNTFTTGGKGWTAELEKGPSEIFGTATNYPSTVSGKVGNAMYFSNGANIEVNDYTSTSLEGSKLSIACWVKIDSTRTGNYIISYNYWNSWKFQIQDSQKPFFTVHTNADGWVDADNELANSVPNQIWTHLVVTLDLENYLLDFYVNGELTKEWDTSGKAGLTGSGAYNYATTLPLIIGACTTYAEAKAAWNWSWSETPEGWDSFIGAIDELKVYNIALTSGQVTKLYNNEK